MSAMQTAAAAYVSDDMIERAMRGAEKVRDQGVRGATTVSVAEIVAMATLLLIFDSFGHRLLPEEDPTHDILA